MKLTKVGQIAMVVKDVEKATAYLQREFGIGPFGIVPLSIKGTFRGREIEYKIRTGITRLGEVMFEVIEVVEGECALNAPEYLPPSGQGVHHIGFFVEDLDEGIKEWEAQGGKVIQRGSFAPGAGTAYLDTPQHAGILVELIQLPGAKK